VESATGPMVNCASAGTGNGVSNASGPYFLKFPTMSLVPTSHRQTPGWLPCGRVWFTVKEPSTIMWGYTNLNSELTVVPAGSMNSR